MNKREFLDALGARLSALPEKDVAERVGFYAEMIDDRVEAGLSEEDAVLEIGSVESVLAEILADTPLTTLVKEQLKPKRRLKRWELALLLVGSPVWASLLACLLSLLVCLLSVLLSLYATLWSLVASLWAVLGALVGSALGGVALGATQIVGGNLAGVALLGAALACTGLAILAFFGCTASVRGTLLLTRKLVLVLKRAFVRKETAK